MTRLLSCLFAAFRTVKALDLFLISSASLGDTSAFSLGNRLEKHRKTDGQTGKGDKEIQGWTLSERESQRSDESARIKDERAEMCGGEGHRRGRRAGQRMERLVSGNRVSLDANSSHLERLMHIGQHFCSYPGSLPPQSITRQSIKSSKKARKALAKALRGMMLLSAALLLLSQPDVCWFHAWLIQSEVTYKIVLFSQNNLCQRY